MFAQAAKEQDLELIVNMSHIQSRPDARSKATQNHWLAEQVFDWSGVPTTHLRITFFMQWLLYSPT
jgi:NAD(P)H dehydrogenase (quinone)